MKSKFCFTLINPKTKKPIKICICIPILYDPYWWLKPQPDPRRWIEIEGVKPQVIDDLAILNTIGDLSEQLSPALSKRFLALTKESLEAHVQSLPIEASLGVINK